MALPILRGSIIGTAELKRRLAKMTPAQNAQIVRKSLIEAGGLVQRNAQLKQIIPSGGGAANPAPVHPTRLTSRHGGAGLVGHIKVDQRPLPRAVEIGTELLYGALHEFGMGRFPVRAFLAPALEAERSGFPAIVVKHWKREGEI